MRNRTQTFRIWPGPGWRLFCRSACLALFLSGCLAPPKRHVWMIPPPAVQGMQGSASWPRLSTNQYARVPETTRSNAVALLQDTPFVRLDPTQLAAFAPALRPAAGQELQPYLVRGVSYSPRPTYTVVRFDPTGASLLVQQVSWDGEMLMPFRWVAEPNALVVFLPREPDRIYPDAVLGGDWVFRDREPGASDSR